jgi:hypothetical protein
MRARLALFALLIVVVPAFASGCFFLFLSSSCVENVHCPAPEQCLFGGTCVNPEIYLAGGQTSVCTDDSQCPESECYEGYCIITDFVDGEGCDAHTDCPVSGTYCQFDGACSTAGEETVYEAEDPVLETIVIDTEAELDQALAATVVAGDLYIGTDIPQVASQDFGRGELVFPNLHTITGQLIIENQASTTLISMPALERVGGISLEIENNAALQEIDLGNLTTIEDRDGQPGIISIGGNPSLNRVDLTLVDGLRAFNILLDPTDAVTPPGPVTLFVNSLTNVTFSYGILAFSGTTFHHPPARRGDHGGELHAQRHRSRRDRWPRGPDAGGRSLARQPHRHRRHPAAAPFPGDVARDRHHHRGEHRAQPAHRSRQHRHQRQRQPRPVARAAARGGGEHVHRQRQPAARRLPGQDHRRRHHLRRGGFQSWETGNMGDVANCP